MKSLSKIVESNRARITKQAATVMTAAKESVNRWGLDIDKEPVFADPENMDFVKLRESAYRHAATVKESNAEGVFSALLKAGLNIMANKWYTSPVPTVHEQIALVTTSDKAVEPYAPLQRLDLPSRVGKGERFKETEMKGLDIQIRNYKYGQIVNFERELFDDDQSNQIKQKAEELTSNMPLWENIYFALRFIGAAATYGGRVIPASETFATVWASAATGIANVISSPNRPATYVVFGADGLLAAEKALMGMKDALGNKMLVQPDTIYHGISNFQSVRTLMNSAFYPFTSSLKAGGTGGSDTGIGAVHAENVLKGAYKPVMDRFLPDWAWALGEAGKGMVFQRRDPTEIIQENPMSGEAFSADGYRFKSRARWETDWVGLGFWYLGNDGSVH